MQVGDARGRDGLDDRSATCSGSRLEERPAAAEQDRHLVQDQLVDEPGFERRGHDSAAHQRDVLVAGELAGSGDRVLDAGGDERLPVVIRAPAGG